YDLLVRWLAASGYDVTFVRNVTDVDDKIINVAAQTGRQWFAVAEANQRVFNRGYDELGCVPPTVEPRATGHVPEMITLMRRLIENGHAYNVDDDVYFDVMSWADRYGSLSHQNLENMRAAGDSAGDDRKRDPRDFALWKGAKPGEPSWETPWGPGRPGWHLECSAMATKYLGPAFDIHGGGVDLIFPHHENEMAQGLCASHAKEYARYWVHNGFLNFGDEKMSKSLGNVALAHDLIKQVPGEVLRWALLVGHYRAPLEWTGDLIDQSRRSLDRIYRTLADLAREAANARVTLPEPDQKAVQGLLDASGLTSALEDDLNTPLALSGLFTLAAGVRAALVPGADWQEVADIRAALLQGGDLLGVLQSDPEAWFQGGADEGLKARIEGLIAARVAARAARDFSEADRIRAELTALNVEVMDGPTGATWRIREPG
ncbi:cysteine--tRNA ligase, partial [Phenylobacterium sp.]|uniref:cysteine--tRNA ligase n=1 Tax=Phenylobacterium sp. TaxID=1871053 RepID=UPI002F3EB886